MRTSHSPVLLSVSLSLSLSLSLLDPTASQTLSEGSSPSASAMANGPVASSLFVVSETQSFGPNPPPAKRSLIAYSTDPNTLGKRLWEVADAWRTPAVSPESGNLAVLTRPAGFPGTGNAPRLLISASTGVVTQNSTVANEGSSTEITTLTWLREGTLAFAALVREDTGPCPPMSKFCGVGATETFVYPAGKILFDPTGQLKPGPFQGFSSDWRLLPAPVAGDENRVLFGAVNAFPNAAQVPALFAVDPFEAVVKKVFKLSELGGAMADVVVARGADGNTQAIYTLEARAPLDRPQELDLIVSRVASDLGSVVWSQTFKASPSQLPDGFPFPAGSSGFRSSWIALEDGVLALAAELAFFNSVGEEVTPPTYAFSGGGKTAEFALQAGTVGPFDNFADDNSKSQTSDIVILKMDLGDGNLVEEPRLVGTQGRDKLLRNIPVSTGGLQYVGNGILAIAGEFGDGRNVYFDRGDTNEGGGKLETIEASGSGGGKDCEE